jgi:hypothetical protein
MSEFEAPVEQDGAFSETVAPEPVEPSWQGPSQDEWQQTQNLIAYVAQAIQPQEEQPGVDPFADDFQARLDQYIDQRLAPIQSVQQEAVMGRAEEQAMEMLTGYAQADPFIYEGSLQNARKLANDFLPQAQQQFGYGPRAAEEALKAAHKAVREWEGKVGEAYHQRQMEQLRGLGQVRREPSSNGMNGQTSQLITSSGPGDERSVLNKYFNN